LALAQSVSNYCHDLGTAFQHNKLKFSNKKWHLKQLVEFYTKFQVTENIIGTQASLQEHQLKFYQTKVEHLDRNAGKDMFQNRIF